MNTIYWEEKKNNQALNFTGRLYNTFFLSISKSHISIIMFLRLFSSPTNLKQNGTPLNVMNCYSLWFFLEHRCWLYICDYIKSRNVGTTARGGSSAAPAGRSSGGLLLPSGSQNLIVNINFADWYETKINEQFSNDSVIHVCYILL